MSIFDRWGNLMFVRENFEPNIPSNGWDGTFNGMRVEQGVYVYKVEYESRVGKRMIGGDITVLR
jgi:gliding motility-associated-like protein